MQYQEDSSFLYRSQPSNKRKYLAMALGVVMLVGAVYYYNQPAELTDVSFILQENHTPTSDTHLSFSSADQAEMLKWTNFYRCMHGAPAVTWNHAMYNSVEATFGHATQMKHSHSYQLTSAQGGPAGENLYMSSNRATAHAAVDAWYDEVNACGAFPGCKSGASGTTGHFTALVWKGVKHIACTRSASKTGLIACRYGNGPGSTLSGATPNMGGNYKSNVFGQTGSCTACGMSASECSANGGGQQGGHGGNGGNGGHGGQDDDACIKRAAHNNHYGCSAYHKYCGHNVVKQCCPGTCGF